MLFNSLFDFFDETIVLTVVFLILLFVKRSRVAAREHRRREKINYEIHKRLGHRAVSR